MTIQNQLYKDIIWFINNKNDISCPYLQNEYLNSIAWMWTEYHTIHDDQIKRGKYISRYWSEKALTEICNELGVPSIVESYCNRNEIIDLRIPITKGNRNPKLIAEHVITKKLFVDTIKAMQCDSIPEDFEKILLNRYFSCIITKGEANSLGNKKYPDSGMRLYEPGFDCWARYKLHNKSAKETINVFECSVGFSDQDNCWMVSILLKN